MSRLGRKSVIITVIAVGLSAAGVALAMRKPMPEPPVLNDMSQLDPQLIKLVQSALAQVEQSPRNAASRARLALVYHGNSLLNVAEPAYEHALLLDPRNPKLWYCLALVRFERTSLDGALEAMDRAISLDATYAPAHWRRGTWLLDAGRVGEAEAAFRRAQQADAKCAEAMVGLARVAIQQRQYPRAVELLNQVIAANPGSPNLPYFRQLLGSAQRHLGGQQQAGALSLLTQSGGMTTQHNDAWHAEALRHRTGYRSTVEQASSLISVGKADAAIAQLQALLRERPGDVPALIQIAEAHYSMQQWDKGIATLHTALASNPDHVPTHINLSHGYEGKGDNRKALEHARRAVELNPAIGLGQLQLGRLLILENRLSDAVEPLSAALAHGVSDPNVRVMLGRVHMNLGNFREAARLFDQARRAAPSLVGAHIGWGLSRAELGDLPSALAALRQAQQMNPNEPGLAEAARRVQQLQAAAGRPNP